MISKLGNNGFAGPNRGPQYINKQHCCIMNRKQIQTIPLFFNPLLPVTLTNSPAMLQPLISTTSIFPSDSAFGKRVLTYWGIWEH